MLPKQGDKVEFAFTDWMILKGVVICVAAIIYGFYMGITGQ